MALDAPHHAPSVEAETSAERGRAEAGAAQRTASTATKVAGDSRASAAAPPSPSVVPRASAKRQARAAVGAKLLPRIVIGARPSSGPKANSVVETAGGLLES